MAGEWLKPQLTRVEAKALRTLVRAGCGPEALDLLKTDPAGDLPSGAARNRKLEEIAEFVTAIGHRAAHDYFRSIEETKAVAELTDRRVLEFARSVDRHTAEWYFWAMWGTKAVPELTDERVLKAVEFFRSIDSPATVEYFLAIRETRAAAELTNEKVLSFAQSIGSDAAVEYFGACWETKAVRELTNDRVLDFARSLSPVAAKEYFLAIRETNAAVELTSDRVLAFARALGSRVVGDYFRAIRETKSVAELTDENVLIFAEVIGKSASREYFRVIGSTKAVAELTSETVLRASAVIQAIGSDAALDYFLAAAAAKALPPPTGAPGAVDTPTRTATVPVLTLLDIPTYEHYRPAALLGVTALFWWSIWQYAGVSVGAFRGLWVLSAALGVWVGLLVGAYMVFTTITERSTQEFLKARRRLLNEHGIRWHDCLAGEQRCELCWGAGHTHDDRQYDYGAFCRCPAC